LKKLLIYWSVLWGILSLGFYLYFLKYGAKSDEVITIITLVLGFPGSILAIIELTLLQRLFNFSSILQTVLFVFFSYLNSGIIIGLTYWFLSPKVKNT